MVAAAGYARRDVRTARHGHRGIIDTTRIFSQARQDRAAGLATLLEMCTRSLAMLTPHYDRRPVAAVSQNPAVGGGQLVPRNGDARQPAFGSEPWLQESSERCYKLSVHSRTAYSRLALQTRDLDARKANFAGIWGDFGGTLRRAPWASFSHPPGFPRRTSFP